MLSLWQTAQEQALEFAIPSWTWRFARFDRKKEVTRKKNLSLLDLAAVSFMNIFCTQSDLLPSSVLSGFLPYFFIGGMINQLLAGNKARFLPQQSAWAGGLNWLLGISRYLPPCRRIRLLLKFWKCGTARQAGWAIPLGTQCLISHQAVIKTSLRRVDATRETTLAHLIPEFRILVRLLSLLPCWLMAADYATCYIGAGLCSDGCQ